MNPLCLRKQVEANRKFQTWTECEEQKLNSKWIRKAEELEHDIRSGFINAKTISLATGYNPSYIKGALDAYEIHNCYNGKNKTLSKYSIKDLSSKPLFNDISEKLSKLHDAMLPKKTFYKDELISIRYFDGTSLNVKEAMERRNRQQKLAREERRTMDKVMEQAYKMRRDGDSRKLTDIVSELINEECFDDLEKTC